MADAWRFPWVRISTKCVRPRARHSHCASDPWDVFDGLMKGSVAGGGDEVLGSVGETHRKIWAKLPAERKALLQLLSRFAITRDQATRYYQPTEREKAGLALQDKDIL